MAGKSCQGTTFYLKVKKPVFQDSLPNPQDHDHRLQLVPKLKIDTKISSSNLGGSGPPTPNYPKNHVKKKKKLYRFANATTLRIRGIGYNGNLGFQSLAKLRST
eukprot:SAG11_NODE_23055_length_395_cov_256.712838_1_plen_103_part_10